MTSLTNVQKKFLDTVLTQNVVVSTVSKKDLMIVLPCLGKLSLQIHTRINRVIKNKLPHCNFRIVFQSKCKLISFFTFQDKIPIFYVNVVAAMLSIMAKLSAKLKSECVNILEFLLLLERE